MSDNPKKLPSSRYLNEIRDTLSSIATTSKSTSCKEVLTFLTNVEVFKILAVYVYDHKLIRTDTDIHDTVKLWCTNRTTAIQKYGNISDWDVSNVTNMNSLFEWKISFNDDISKWDVSNVTNMEYMFCNAFSFNKDIDEWDVSNVTNMKCMFMDACRFNKNIGSWNVSNVTTMEAMFRCATDFN